VVFLALLESPRVSGEHAPICPHADRPIKDVGLHYKRF